MGILINKFIIGTIKGRALADGSMGIASYNKDNWNRNKLLTFQKFVSIPVGTRPPHCLLLAQESGGLASHGECHGISTVNTNLAGGVNKSSAISGASSVNADMFLLMFTSATVLASSTVTVNGSGAVSGSTNITGSGTIANALPFALVDLASAIVSGSIMSGPDLISAINIYADITSAGAWNNANGSLLGILDSVINGSTTVMANGSPALNLSSSIDGLGDFTSAQIAGLGWVVVNAIGGSLLSNTNSPSPAWINADVTPFTELSPQTLSKAVWDQLASDNNAAGTMGFLLNNVTTGGVTPEDIASAVWEALAASQNNTGSMGELVNIIKSELDKKLKRNDFLALK